MSDFGSNFHFFFILSQRFGMNYTWCTRYLLYWCTFEDKSLAFSWLQLPTPCSMIKLEMLYFSVNIFATLMNLWLFYTSYLKKNYKLVTHPFLSSYKFWFLTKIYLFCSFSSACGSLLVLLLSFFLRLLSTGGYSMVECN